MPVAANIAGCLILCDCRSWLGASVGKELRWCGAGTVSAIYRLSLSFSLGGGGFFEMSVSEKIRSNLAVHGMRFAGRIAKQQKIPFDMFYFVIFGRYPTK